MNRRVVSATGKQLPAQKIELVSLGAKLLLPGPAGEVSSYAIERLTDFVNKRNATRYQDFHKSLLSGEVELSGAEIDEVDYHALLNACLTDIEDLKTAAYAELARSIALGRVNDDHRRHFIIAMRDLAFEHLDLLRHLYVISRYRIPNPQGAGARTVKSELSDLRQGTVLQLAFNAVHTKGFTDSEKLSDLGIEFVESCTQAEYLEPGAYGYSAWTGYKCQIISLVSNEDADVPLINSVEDRLRRSRIECGGAVLLAGVNDNLRSLKLYANCAIVLTDHASRIPEEKGAILREIFAKVPAVQICVGGRAKFELLGLEVAFKDFHPTEEELDSLMRIVVHLVAKPA